MLKCNDGDMRIILMHLHSKSDSKEITVMPFPNNQPDFKTHFKKVHID